MNRFFLSLLVLLIVALFSVTSGFAEEGEKKSYAIAPLIISNPNIGTGGGVAGMYFFDVGDITEKQPRSFIQAFGAYTNTQSYFGGIISNFHLKNDYVRAKIGIFHASINNEYRDPLGDEVNFNNGIINIFGKVSYQVWDSNFLGIQAIGTDNTFDPDSDTDKDYLDRVGAEDNSTAGVGPTYEYDSRNSSHYPSSGTHIEIKGFYKPSSWGNEEDYAVGDAAIDHFIKIADDQILALRLFGRTGTENTPYSDKSRLGQRSDLRGFKSGEITALTILATQAEYRYQLTERWGIVGFGGVSKLWDDDLEELITEDIYYSGGAGIRYMINMDQKINFRVDVAIGNDDNKGIYVGIREAF